jgi:hypothetical protein
MGCAGAKETLEDKMLLMKLDRLEIQMRKEVELKKLNEKYGEPIRKSIVPDYIDPKFAKEYNLDENYEDIKVDTKTEKKSEQQSGKQSEQQSEKQSEKILPKKKSSKRIKRNTVNVEGNFKLRKSQVIDGNKNNKDKSKKKKSI